MDDPPELKFIPERSILVDELDPPPDELDPEDDLVEFVELDELLEEDEEELELDPEDELPELEEDEPGFTPPGR